jgi:hypothetical protein
VEQIELGTYWLDSTRYGNIKIKRRICGHQRGNQNLYIEEEQTTQWPKEKVQTAIYKTYT